MPKALAKSDPKPSSSKSFPFTFGNPVRHVSKNKTNPNPSPVQKLFKKNNDGFFGAKTVTCNICKKEFAHASGNTSTLSRHANSNHSGEWNAILESENVAKEQPKITSHFSLPQSEKIQKYKTDSLKQKKLNPKQKN